MSVSAPSRLTPPGRMTPFRAQRIWERNYLVYRRVWKVVITGFFEPVFYLFSIGIGIGSLVGEVTLPGGVTVDYTAFVAPALMAASAMNGTVLETTFNIFFRLKFDKVYDGILTTPMGPRDIAIGEIGWALLRGALYAVAFLVVMVIMGLTTNWWAILTIPGRGPHRIRLRVGRSRRHHLYALMAGLRPRLPGDDAAVPVLCDLLSTRYLSPGVAAARPIVTALSRERVAPCLLAGHRGLVCGRPHRLPAGDGSDRSSHRLPSSRRVVTQVAATVPAG